MTYSNNSKKSNCKEAKNSLGEKYNYNNNNNNEEEENKDFYLISPKKKTLEQQLIEKNNDYLLKSNYNFR